MVSAIITNTPTWVWGLLLALLVLGFSQVRSREIGKRRILILPLVMTCLSFSGTVSSFGAAPLVLGAWIAATGIAVWQILRRRVPPLTDYNTATGLFHLPGSWLPMSLITGVFAVKYVVGVSVAMKPALAMNTGFAISIALLYGLFGGVFIGRAMRLWLLAKSSTRIAVSESERTARLPD